MKIRPCGWKVVVAGLGSLTLYLASSFPLISEEKKCAEPNSGLQSSQGVLRDSLCRQGRSRPAARGGA